MEYEKKNFTQQVYYHEDEIGTRCDSCGRTAQQLGDRYYRLPNNVSIHFESDTIYFFTVVIHDLATGTDQKVAAGHACTNCLEVIKIAHRVKLHDL